MKRRLGAMPERNRPPKRLSAAMIEPAAVDYLARFAASSAQLRRVLLRKAMRSARHWGDDPEPLIAAIDRFVDRMTEAGVLDDRAFAEARSAMLRRRGLSARAITARLAAKGVPSDLAQSVVPREDDAERAAAAAFARRRGLGPYRQTARGDYRQKDLAVLGRAGFDYRIAAEIVDAGDPEHSDGCPDDT